ncbi:MAG TPA: hypothetical protein VLS86_09860, partial [Acidimicrobiia bacterium]|nr:hypothetical protein [Acidimicrobiia bacterium]
MTNIPIIEKSGEGDLTPTSDGRPKGVMSRRVTLVVLLAMVLLYPFIARSIFSSYNYVMQLGIVVLMWIAMSSSWNIIGGFAGYISLGHAVFYAIGGYVSGMMLIHWGVSPFLTAPIAGLAAV